MIRAYIIQGADGEYVLVVRTKRLDLVESLVRRMSRMRNDKLSQIGRALEEDLMRFEVRDG